MPCVVKPVMSLVRARARAWCAARTTSSTRGSTRRPAAAPAQGRVIVEGFIEFDYEITLLTVRHVDGTSFCEPIGHLQRDGDYRESWQPQADVAAGAARGRRAIARAVTDDLGGWGVFGVELFVKGDDGVIFAKSPRGRTTPAW